MARKKPEKAEIIETIQPGTLDELMGERFDIYAKDVIQDRAIPDARDGMKPVQRRIIYAMWKTGNTIDKPTKKCAHIVGEVMGKYHPHGDSSIYDALVRMSQGWRMRAPLVDFQGNNGSIDGDSAAAYRYTEARLSAISQELVRDLNKDTVDMGLTFDDSEFEPLVLPSRFPNMLVNGASGIAVGLATEIPPHNLKEVIDAVIYRLERPSCPIESLMRFVPGPDFPTGGVIYQSQGLQDIYLTGRGSITVACKYHFETTQDGINQIIITEIPYGVIKSALVGSIDRIRHDKDIDGIDEVRDETDRSGMRIAIDLKNGFKPEAVLSYLMAKTKLRTSYSANMVAIVDGRPVTMNLLTYCDTYIAHQKDVVTRRARFDLAKAKARLNIVDGLIKAASIINEVIAVIRASKDKADSKINLQSRFAFNEEQSEAIVMMPLYKLSHTDIDVLMAERDQLHKDIDSYNALLGSEEVLNKSIISDLRAVSKAYADKRRTQIQEEDDSLKVINRGDLVAKEEVMVVLTRDGYVKRSSIASYKGSGGHNGVLPGLKSKDTFAYIDKCVSTDHLLIFTNMGQYIELPVHLLKANKWLDEGIHINYTASLSPKEKIVRAFCIKSWRDDLFVVLASRKGLIKRVRLSSFKSSRLGKPLRAMKLLSGDELSCAAISSGNSQLFLFSEHGLCANYSESEITPTSTGASGVKAASFHGEDVVALFALYPDEGCKFALITDMGAIRVLSSSNVKPSGRLNKATTVFKSFKKEPNSLIFAYRVKKEDEAPLTFHATCSGGDYIDVTFQDLFLTPMDKIAKGEIKLPKGQTIADVNSTWGEDVDDSIKSLLPDEEGKVEEDAVPEDEPTKKSDSSIVEDDSDGVNEKYEQISIFDDFDFDK